MPTLQAKRGVRIVGDDDFDWSAHDPRPHIPNAALLQTMDDVDAGRNLIGPFATVEEAMASMMSGWDELDDEDD